MAVTDGVIIKGRHMVITEVLKPQVLDPPHISHMGIGKTKLLVQEFIYWPNISNDIKNIYRENCTTCLMFQQMQPKDHTS